MPKGVHNNHPKMEKHGRWKGGIKIHRGYVLIRKPDHPYINKSGYIKRATLILEKKLGRLLLPGEEAHHIDENKQNDDPENLECKTHAAHIAYHVSRRPKIRETRYCIICGKAIIRCPSHFQNLPERTVCGHKCRIILIAKERDKRGRFCPTPNIICKKRKGEKSNGIDNKNRKSSG